jgi:hypothetical protein
VRPVVCVYSNCQGESLIGFLRSHPDFADSEFVFLRAWLKDSPSADQLRRCSHLLYQSSFGAPAFLGQIPSAARRLRIPLLTCAVLWPYGFDKPNEPVGWRFPYGDRFLAGQIAQSVSPQQAVQAYLALDIPAHLNMARLLELEFKKYWRQDADTDVSLAPLMESQLLTERLFFTPDHPTDQLLLAMVNQILQGLGVRTLPMPDWSAHQHSLRNAEVPVHASIARHFALPYVTADMRHPMFGGWLELTEPAFYLRYAQALTAPSMDAALIEAAQALHAGDVPQAVNICSLVRQRDPENPWAAALLALVNALVGNRAQATGLCLEAVSRALSPIEEKT